MSSVQYSQVPIRAQLSIVSNPPVAPVDINTGLQPQFWRAQGIAIDVAIFDVNSVAVDLSNLVSLTATLLPSANSAEIAAAVTVLASSIIPTVDIAGWENGTEQQAKFVFTPAQTDVGLGGGQSLDYWLVIQGLTTGGQLITYGAGAVTVFNPGPGIPAAVGGGVSFHAQTNSSGTSTITPASQMHTELFTVGGTARTSPVIVSTAGLQAGAHVKVLLAIPLLAGIILAFHNGIISGPVVYTFSSDGTHATAIIDLCFDGNQLQMFSVQQPAY